MCDIIPHSVDHWYVLCSEAERLLWGATRCTPKQAASRTYDLEGEKSDTRYQLSMGIGIIPLIRLISWPNVCPPPLPLRVSAVYQNILTASHRSDSICLGISYETSEDALAYGRVPAIQESAADLQRLFKTTHHPLLHQRVHALFLLASGQVTTRTQAARLVGINRETVGDWLRIYAAKGLAALLTRKTPPGAVSRLTPEARADLERALRDPEGFPSSDAIRDWLWQQHGIHYNTRSLSNLCRITWGIRANFVHPRPKKST
ncbi:MAG: helix-turn-helix domain-containing protein [Chloroflexaceae bacterium]|nr:helix-turn-helix domain-containing protein [Chloroflexaceae bacterium]